MTLSSTSTGPTPLNRRGAKPGSDCQASPEHVADQPKLCRASAEAGVAYQPELCRTSGDAVSESITRNKTSAPWTRLGSNQEPTDYESAALTIELRVLRLT